MVRYTRGGWPGGKNGESVILDVIDSQRSNSIYSLTRIHASINPNKGRVACFKRRKNIATKNEKNGDRLFSPFVLDLVTFDVSPNSPIFVINTTLFFFTPNYILNLLLSSQAIVELDIYHLSASPTPFPSNPLSFDEHY